MYRFPNVRPAPQGSQSPAPQGSQSDAATGSATGSENGSTGSESLARNGTPEQLGEQRASARPPKGERPDTRKAWQIRNDADAAAKLEAARPRTAEELALIAERKRLRDQDDARHTAEQDARLDDLTPAAEARSLGLLRRLGIEPTIEERIGHGRTD